MQIVCIQEPGGLAEPGGLREPGGLEEPGGLKEHWVFNIFYQHGGPHFLTRLGTCKKREGDKGGREREEGKEREKGKQGREEEREGRHKFKTSDRRWTRA